MDHAAALVGTTRGHCHHTTCEWPLCVCGGAREGAASSAEQPGWRWGEDAEGPNGKQRPELSRGEGVGVGVGAAECE